MGSSASCSKTINIIVSPPDQTEVDDSSDTSSFYGDYYRDRNLSFYRDGLSASTLSLYTGSDVDSGSDTWSMRERAASDGSRQHMAWSQAIPRRKRVVKAKHGEDFMDYLRKQLE